MWFFASFAACAVFAHAQVIFPPDLTISRIEVTQAIQDEAQSVPLVAGKSTAVRVFVRQQGNPDTLISGVTVALRGFREGNELASSPLRAVNLPIRAQAEPDRGNPNHSQNFILPEAWTQAGTLVLQAELRLAPGTVESPSDNNTLSRPVEFIPAAAELRVSWLPVCFGARCPSANVEHHQLAQKLFAIADATMRYEDVPVPPIRWELPLADATTSSALLAHLRKWWAFLQDSPVRPHLLAGWLPGGTAALAPGAARDRVSWLVPQQNASSNQRLLAQQLASSAGLAPVEGGCSAQIRDPGFDPLTARLVPAASVPYMAGCDTANLWTDTASAASLYSILQSYRTEPTGARQNVLIVSGSTRGSGGQLDHAYLLLSTAGTDAFPGGPYCLRVTSTQGDSDYCMPLAEDASFTVRLPVPGPLSRVTLLREGAELASLATAERTPLVNITSPAVLEEWSGQRTVRWTASDPAGRPMTYTLFYSNDVGASWTPIAVDVREPEYVVDTQYLPGGMTRFRVLAAAGLDTGQGDSAEVDIRQGPRLELPLSVLQFGSTTTGQIAERSLTVRNRGTGILEFSSYSLGGAFRISSISPFRVRPGAERALPVRYRPVTPGVETAEVSALTNDSVVRNLTLMVRGSAFDRPVPSITATPASVDFGVVPVGETRDVPVVVRNEGTAPLEVTSLSTVNSRFSVTGAAARFTLEPGEERTLVARFAPNAIGIETGALALAANDPSTPSFTVSLRGAGQIVAVPRMEVTPISLDFGSVNAGQVRNLSVTVRNAGNAPLTIRGLQTNTPVFVVQSPAVPVTVPAGGQQVVSLRFAPNITGVLTGALTIESNDTARPQVTVALAGTGLPAVVLPAPRISSLVPASLTAGSLRFNLTVNGSNFTTASAVYWNGIPLGSTTFVSSTTLRASIAPTDVASASTAQVTVVTPPPGGGTSNSLEVVVNPQGRTAQITNITADPCPTVFATMSVTDLIGSPITALNNGNVVCTEDVVPVTCSIRPAEPSGSGLSVVLVLQRNPGITGDPIQYRNNINNQQIAAIRFTDSVGLQDRVAIAQYDNGVRLVRDFTLGENREALQDAVKSILDKAPLGTGVALYDAIEFAIRRLAEPAQRGRRKAVVLFTASKNDYDTFGPRESLDPLFSLVQTSGVPLYLVPLGDAFQNESLLSLLNQFALDSSGRLFFESNPRTLEQLASVLASQHLLNYDTQNRDGQPHTLRVTVSVPGGSFTAARPYPGCR